MHIEPDQLVIVREILQKHIPNLEVWAFGSRVHGHNLKPFSDLDLVIISKQGLAIEKMAKLTHEFRQSDLPFTVDIVDWNSLEENFRNKIKDSYEVVKAGIKS